MKLIEQTGLKSGGEPRHLLGSIARAARPAVALMAMTALMLSLTAGTPALAQTPPKTAAKGPLVQPPQPPPPPPPFAGIWIDDTGDGAVEILPCPAPAIEQYCGQIVWLKKETDARGRPLHDGYNEDPRARKRPICGLPVIGGMRLQPNGTLDDGWIYDPRRGQRFDLELTLVGPDKLQVMGYKGFKFLSKTFMWTRAQTELPKCIPPV